MNKADRFLIILHAIGIFTMLIFGAVMLVRQENMAQQITTHRRLSRSWVDDIEASQARRDSLLSVVIANQDTLKALARHQSPTR